MNTILHRNLLSRIKLLLSLAVCLAAGQVCGHAQSQDDITVAFLFNFARFVEWPSSAFASGDAPFKIGFVGRPALADRFAEVVQGKNIGSRELAMRKFDDASSVADCQIVYVADDTQASAVVAALKNKPVLTVGEGDSFLAAGGMISLNRAGARLVFDINPHAMSAGGLSASEKLSKSARSVKNN